MWKIYLNDSVLYDDEAIDTNDVIEDDATLELELNAAGNLSFTIPENHSMYSSIVPMKSRIRLTKNGTEMFRGRVIATDVDFYNSKTVECEGELGYLNDTVIEYGQTFAGAGADSIWDTFNAIMAQHANDLPASESWKAFSTTVLDDFPELTDDDTISYEYKKFGANCLNALKDLLNDYGGYIEFTHEDGDTNGGTIHILKNPTATTDQPIQLAENLLDINTENAEEFYTALYPYGAESDDDPADGRLSLAYANDTVRQGWVKSGLFVYNQAAVTQYGFIAKTVENKALSLEGTSTEAERRAKANLLYSWAREQITGYLNRITTAEIEAIDLADAGYDFENFKLGATVQIVDTKHQTVHNIASSYRIRKMTVSLFHPEKNTITVGGDTVTLTKYINTKG